VRKGGTGKKREEEGRRETETDERIGIYVVEYRSTEARCGAENNHAGGRFYRGLPVTDGEKAGCKGEGRKGELMRRKQWFDEIATRRTYPSRVFYAGAIVPDFDG